MLSKLSAVQTVISQSENSGLIKTEASSNGT